MPSTATSIIDGLSTSVAVKAPVKAVSTINLALTGLQTVGGVALAAGDRVLVAAQTDTTQNGIYVASTGVWTRAKDFDGQRDVVNNTLVVVDDTHFFYRTVVTEPYEVDESSITFESVTIDDDAAVSVQYEGTGSAALNLHDYIEDDGSYNLMGFVPQGLKAAIRDGTSTADISSYFQDAVDTSRRILLPRGKFVIATPINPTQAGVVGESSKYTKIVCDACHAFEIPSNAGWDRPAGLFANFAVDSSNGTSCDAKFAFYAPGVAALAAAVYNSGLTVRDVEIGRNNRMGGGFYLKDFFRVNVYDVGMTNVSRMIQLVGSVVQCTFRNVKSNNDTAGTTLSRYGISTETATYSGAAVLTPEAISFDECAVIRCERGISHTAGLSISFNFFDCEAETYGALLNAPCKVTKGIIGSSPAAAAWVGIFFGVSPEAHDMRVIEGVEINALNQPGTPTSSYGIDAGDGVSPVRGVVVKDCMIQGVTGSLQSAVRGRILNDFTMEDCGIESDVVTGTNDVDITSSTGLSLRKNRNTSGVWSITDGGDAAAYGAVEGNRLTTLTFTPTTRSNWRMDVNGAVIRRRRGVANIADGGTIAHGLSSTPTYFQATATQSGEFAAITSVDATNLTVAIKKHDGTAGTTQNIHWEAEY